MVRNLVSRGKGLPDDSQTVGFQSTPTRYAAFGQSIHILSFSGTITAGSTGTIDVTLPPSGFEQIFANLAVSTEDDEAIHRARIVRIADLYVFFTRTFIQGLNVDLKTIDISGSDQAQIHITNNHSSDKNYEGTISWNESRLEDPS